MNEIFADIGGLMWGPWSVALMLGVGVWLSMSCGWPQLTRIPSVIRETIGSLFAGRKGSREGITPFQAVSTALAGTMGTGNIAGIATALVAGGPGAIFWMWISALVGMMTKYAEVALAVSYRRRAPGGGYWGGPMVYIEDGLGMRRLSAVFSCCCVLASFGIGNATQVHSAAAALYDTFGVAPATTGIVAGVLTAAVLLGGIKRIGRVAESTIPLVSLFYLAGGCAVLWVNRQNLLPALSLIVESAFNPAAVGGGVCGYTVSNAMRVGVARGVFSNEAGLGSAPMAHASADAKSPNAQGYWGIFEVFADTVLVCTFTALVILSSGNLWRSGLDGASLTSAAFRLAVGRAGDWIVSLSLACFALATLFCWGYYGERGVAALVGARRWPVLLYRLCFVAVAVVSPLLRLTIVWNTSDILNFMMAVPNIFALLALSGEVRSLSVQQKNK